MAQGTGLKEMKLNLGLYLLADSERCSRFKQFKTQLIVQQPLAAGIGQFE
jgi:hypothetical protein